MPSCYRPIASVPLVVRARGQAPGCTAWKGHLALNFGQFWFKNQQTSAGQANLEACKRRLSNLIEARKAMPSFIVSPRSSLDEASKGRTCKHLDARDDGWTKVVLKTAA